MYILNPGAKLPNAPGRIYVVAGVAVIVASAVYCVLFLFLWELEPFPGLVYGSRILVGIISILVHYKKYLAMFISCRAHLLLENLVFFMGISGSQPAHFHFPIVMAFFTNSALKGLLLVRKKAQ